ncbi:MAG: hypothetical protein GY760_17470 [Deltaproteobacteria bacterium]|nr:hypothetical protein [Deltaproteobacteria bacterium]
MEPDVVNSHFDEITTKFMGKTIYMQEIGYQTSSDCNSSVQKQSRFICNVFHAWDQHKDIKLMMFARLNDVTHDKAEELGGPYNVTNDKFIEYLRTLGIRTHDGVLKEGFSELRDHTNIRGWGI